LTENKTNQTSDAQPAARVLLRFTVLAYFSFIIATIFGLGSLLAAYRGAEGIIYTLVPLSPFYLGFALVIISPVWYLYRGIKRRMGSEGPSVGVGIIVPTVIGYSIFVLGPLLGVYPSTVSAIIIDALGDYIGPGAYVGYSVTAILLGPFHIALLYVLVAQEDGHLPRKKVESESGTNGKEDIDTDREDSDTQNGSGAAFGLFVLGYGFLLMGSMFLFSAFPRSVRQALQLGFSYIGASVMVFSQVWYVFVGRRQMSWEELRNTLVKYVGVPSLVVFIMFFLGPTLGLVIFPETAYAYVQDVFRDSLIPVFFFLGPIYAALFYVYKIA